MRFNISKKHLKKISLGFLILFFPLGFFIAKKLNNDDVVMYLTPGKPHSSFRNIASVGQKNIAIPSSLILQPGKLSDKSQHDFVKASALISSAGDNIQFYLARFLVSSTAGEATLVCQKYNQVDIVFKAYSHAIHGHVPQMILKARCKASASRSTQLGPFNIPKKQILNSPISEQLFSSPSSIGRQVLLFSNVGIAWPGEWVLSELKFGNNQNQNFSIYFTSQNPKDYFIVYLK